MFYDSANFDWKINYGSLYGVTKGQKGDTQVYINANDGLTYTGYITEVGTTSAIFRYNNTQHPKLPNKYQSHHGYIGGLLTNNTRFFLAGYQPSIDLIRQEYASKPIYKNDYKLLLVDKEDQADFTLVMIDDNAKRCHLTAPFDHNRPWIEPLYVPTLAAAAKTLTKLSKVAKWHYAKALDNPTPLMSPVQPINITFTQDGKVCPISAEGIVQLTCNIDATNGEVHIRFKNRSNGTLYLAALYLSRQLAIDYRILNSQAIRLKPNAVVYAFGNDAIPISIGNYVKEFDFEEEKIWLKIIVSTTPFDVVAFQQDGFKEPIRGNYLGDKNHQTTPPDWQYEDTWLTQLVEVRIL